MGSRRGIFRDWRATGKLVCLLATRVIASERSPCGDWVADDLEVAVPFSGGLLLGAGFVRETYAHGLHPAWKYERVFELLLENGVVSARRIVPSSWPRFGGGSCLVRSRTPMASVVEWTGSSARSRSTTVAASLRSAQTPSPRSRAPLSPAATCGNA